MKDTRPTMVRVPGAMIDEAKARGLNVAEIMRAALEEALKKKSCPTCGAIVKGKTAK